MDKNIAIKLTPDYTEFTRYFGNKSELYEKLKPLKDKSELTWIELAKVQWWQIDMENHTLDIPVAKIINFELSGTDVIKILECFNDHIVENRKCGMTKDGITIVFIKTEYDERCGILAAEDNRILFLVSERKLQNYINSITAAREGGNPTICSYVHEGIILNLRAKMKRF